MKEKLRSFVKCRKLENRKNKGILGKGDKLLRSCQENEKKKIGSEHLVNN